MSWPYPDKYLTNYKHNNRDNRCIWYQSYNIQHMQHYCPIRIELECMHDKLIYITFSFLYHTNNFQKFNHYLITKKTHHQSRFV